MQRVIHSAYYAYRATYKSVNKLPDYIRAH